MDQRQRADLDRHITGNYGEDGVGDDPDARLAELEEALLAALVAMAAQGANSDPQHPLRVAWQTARVALKFEGAT